MSNAKAADPKLNSTGLWLSSPTHGNSGLCHVNHVSRGGGSTAGAVAAAAAGASETVDGIGEWDWCCAGAVEAIADYMLASSSKLEK